MRKEKLIGVGRGVGSFYSGHCKRTASASFGRCELLRVRVAHRQRCYCAVIQVCTLNVECSGDFGAECEMPIQTVLPRWRGTFIVIALWGSRSRTRSSFPVDGINKVKSSFDRRQSGLRGQ